MTYDYKNYNDIDWDNARIAVNPDTKPHERETYISMDGESDRATIDTMDPAWIKHLIKHPLFECDKVTCTKDRNGNEIIVEIKGTLPKNCIRTSIRPRKRFDRL